LPIATIYNPSKPSETWKKILIEFLIDEFPTSEAYITFSPINLTATWPKDKIIQIIPLSPINKKRYKATKDGVVKTVHKEVMECNIAVLTKNGRDADEISDRLLSHINDNTADLGEAGLQDAYTSSPIFDPFMLGDLAVSRHIHRIVFQIETY
jgi:hypothetical protein